MVNLAATLGLTFWVVSIVNDITNVEILTSWVANNELCFNGVIKIKCAEEVTSGWQMFLKSSQSLSLFNSTHANIRESDASASSFILTNLPWNSQCMAGETIQVSLAGCTAQQNTTPQITVEFHRNQSSCPQVTPPRHRQSIEVPTALIHDDDSVFRVSLIITLPVTVQGNWNIYLAVSTQVSKLNAAGVSSSPSQGDIFTLTNSHWQQMFMAGVTYVLEVHGTKAARGIKDPCITAVFAWDKGMELHPSTTPSFVSSASQKISPTEQQTSGPTFEETRRQTVPLTMTPSITPRIQTSISPTTENWQPTASVTVSTTVPQSCAPYNYNEVLHKSILFYEAQRSGKLPVNNRIAWRGDSALGDQGHNGEDLTGGWYDAGDYVKFGFPMAFSTTLLTWGLVEFPQSYTASGEMENMLSSIKWPLDYFIKAHVNPNEFYGQLGDGDIDHAYWGRPEDMTMSRPAFKIDSTKPGSELAAETAAAMAAGSIAFGERNQSYAELLLDHAKTLYAFADNYRGKYSNSITDAAQFYASSGYEDELSWGAAWLYRATNNETYLQKAEGYFTSYNIGNPAWGFSWDEKIAGVQMLLYELTGKEVYKTAIQNSLDQWLPGGSVVYTPKGLAWRLQWGSNRYAANTAFLALLASTKGLKSTQYREFGEKQINYMLGDSGRSFVVGFGKNPPTQPHHASSSCPDKPATCGWDDFHSTQANPQILYGALVGGPDQNDAYQDKRDDYKSNEVACDYNAGFQSAVAALKAVGLASCSTVVASASQWPLYSSQTTFTLRINETSMMTKSDNPPAATYKTTASVNTLKEITSPTVMTSTSISQPVVKSSETAKNTGSKILTSPYASTPVTFDLSHVTTSPSSRTVTVVTDNIKPSPSPSRSLSPSTALSQVPSPLLSQVESTSSSSTSSTTTERLQSITTLETTYSKIDLTSAINIQSSPTIYVSPSSTVTTEVGGIILPDECGDVSIPSGYYHLEASVRILADWPQGFTGQINVTTTVEVRDGWQIELVMSNAISLLEVYVVTTTPSSGTRFTLKNEDHNKQLEQGSTTKITFKGTKTTENDNVPCMRAVFMWAVEKPCPTIDAVSGSNSIDATAKITSQWNAGITGEITVVVPEQIQSGWQIQVLFDIPLTLTVYDATITSVAGTHYTLANKDYNKQLQVGTTLVLKFDATKQETGSTVLCVDAIFLW